FRTKQGLAAADALVGTRRLGVFVLAGTRRFGTCLTGHKVLIRRELFPPRGGVLANFLFHHYPLSLALKWRLACCYSGLDTEDWAWDSGALRKVTVSKDLTEKVAITEAPSQQPQPQGTPQYSHPRKSRRAKIARPVRVRPSDHMDEHFEDLPISVNASREGIFFTSRRKGYYKGMRVFVTFPFSSPHDPMNCEYVAEVVRVEELP